MYHTYVYSGGSGETLKADHAPCEQLWGKGKDSLEFDPTKRTIICLPGIFNLNTNTKNPRLNFMAMEHFLGPLDRKDAPQIVSFSWPHRKMQVFGIAQHQGDPHRVVSTLARQMAHTIFLPLIANPGYTVDKNLRVHGQLKPMKQVLKNLSRITIFADSFGTNAAQEMAGALFDTLEQLDVDPRELGIKGKDLDALGREPIKMLRPEAMDIVEHVFMLGINNTAPLQNPLNQPRFSGVQVTSNNDILARMTAPDFKQMRAKKADGLRVDRIADRNALSVSFRVPHDIRFKEKAPGGGVVERCHNTHVLGHSMEAYSHLNPEVKNWALILTTCGNALRNMVNRDDYIEAGKLLDPVPRPGRVPAKKGRTAPEILPECDPLQEPSAHVKQYFEELLQFAMKSGRTI